MHCNILVNEEIGSPQPNLETGNILLLYHISKCVYVHTVCAYSENVNFVDKAITMPIW
jgi:hypothetical protein